MQLNAFENVVLNIFEYVSFKYLFYLHVQSKKSSVYSCIFLKIDLMSLHVDVNFTVFRTHAN